MSIKVLTPAVYCIGIKNKETESRRASQNESDCFVINVLEKIRKHAPFPRPVCDIIASYSMSYGDLLEYMPYVFHQDDDEPYTYPKHIYGDGHMYCSGTYFRPYGNTWKSKDDIIFDLEGKDDLFSILASFYSPDRGSDMPDAEIKKISDYYENIARRCLKHLLNSRHRESHDVEL